MNQKIAIYTLDYFLLQVTPVNLESAWSEFKRKRFQRAPVFHYRPFANDPYRLKRLLWDIPIRRIEDPTLAQLFRDKRDELDIQISMLTAIEKPRFLYGSLQLTGTVSDSLLDIARKIVTEIPARSREKNGKFFLNAIAPECSYPDGDAQPKQKKFHYTLQEPESKRRTSADTALRKGFELSPDFGFLSFRPEPTEDFRATVPS